MAQTAQISFKATINGGAVPSFEDTIAVAVDSSVAVMNESIPPGQQRDYELYAGSKEGIEVVFVKLVPADAGKENGNGNGSGNGNGNGNGTQSQAPRQIRMTFAQEGEDVEKTNRWLVLPKSTLLLGRAAQDLMPPKVERIVVKNDFMVPATLSVLVARKKPDPPKKALQKDG